MTRAKIIKRIAYWQKVMGLGSWELFLSDHPADDDALANTNPSIETRHAAIRIRKGAPDDQVDRLIVHELTHVALCEMSTAFRQGVEGRSHEAQEILGIAWERAEEWFCERMATAFTGVSRVEFGDDAPEVWKSVTPVR